MNKVDIFFLFDDSDSTTDQEDVSHYRQAISDNFANVRADIGMRLPGIDVGYGVGRFEGYAYRPDNGTPNTDIDQGRSRPFILNQPVIAGHPDHDAIIQSALDRNVARARWANR